MPPQSPLLLRRLGRNLGSFRRGCFLSRLLLGRLLGEPLLAQLRRLLALGHLVGVILRHGVDAVALLHFLALELGLGQRLHVVLGSLAQLTLHRRWARARAHGLFVSVMAGPRPAIRLNNSPLYGEGCPSRTPCRRPACVALHAGAVAHQREVAAFAAGLALVAFGAGFRALFRGRRLGVLLGVERVDAVFELL